MNVLRPNIALNSWFYVVYILLENLKSRLSEKQKQHKTKNGQTEKRKTKVAQKTLQCPKSKAC